jgi:GT2 family glycosyltransferase
VSPRVTAVVVSWNTREELLAALRSLGTQAEPVAVVVVDNASADGSAAAVREAFPAATVVANAENVGFGRAANQGLRAAQTPYVLLLNSDAELRPGALAALAAVLDERPDVAIVGPRTRFADGAIQLSWGARPGLLAEWKQRRLVRGLESREGGALRHAEALAGREHEPDWLSASCWLARREALDAVGLFDEGFFLYWEDVDLCLRLRDAGWRLVFTPTAEVVHRQGVSKARSEGHALAEYHRSHLRFYRKHNGPASTGLLWLAQRLRGAH